MGNYYEPCLTCKEPRNKLGKGFCENCLRGKDFIAEPLQIKTPYRRLSLQEAIGNEERYGKLTTEELIEVFNKKKNNGSKKM